MFYYIVISTVGSLLFMAALFFVFFPPGSISLEQLLEPRMLFSIMSIVVAVFVMVFLLFLTHRMVKFAELTEAQKKGAVGRDMKSKMTKISWLMLIPVLLMFFFIGGFTPGNIAVIVVVVVMLMALVYGLHFLVKKSEAASEKNNNVKSGVIAAVLIIAIFVGPALASYLVHSGMQIANDPADISECFSQMRTESMRYSCIERHFGYVHDISFCNSVEQKQIDAGVPRGTGDFRSYFYGRDECLQSLANYANDISVCSEISVRDSKDYCVYGFAVQKRDVSLCMDLSDEGLMQRKTHCILHIAEALKDANLCNMIDDNFYFRSDCLENISK